MSYKQMGDKNYLFFVAEGKSAVYDSGRFNKISKNFNYLQAVRYLKLLINPFYVIGNLF